MSQSAIVAITGSSGMIGTALAASLRRDGIGVRRIVRRPARTADEISWRPGSALDPGSLRGVTAVVNLAGAPVADRRWNREYKRIIRSSRVDATRTICDAVARMDDPVSVVVSQSAIGYYGDTGTHEVDETSPRGSGYFSDVTAVWEAAADPAREAGIRVVHPRTAIVLSSRGGALHRMLPLFKVGLGGRLGGGRQYWTWISLHDAVAGLRYLIDSGLAGPVNLASPHASTNAEITRALAQELHRPAVLPVPAVAIRVAIGEFSSEVLGSIRVRPARLLETSFTWREPRITDAIRAARSGW